MTATLPASVKATDILTMKIDDETMGTFTVEQLNFVKQGDGSWQYVSTSSASVMNTTCSGSMTQGTHTMSILDASGTVLAEGSWTITP